MDKRALTPKQVSEYTRIAYYYYKEGLTQGQIGENLKMSRQRINRILYECVEQGIVQITIKNTDRDHLELEGKIKKKYGLKDIRIIDNVGEENIYRDLGIAAGEYLASIIQNGDIIGLSRGRTMAAVAEYMPPVHKKDLFVAQLLGSRNEEQKNTAAAEIVHDMAKKLNAKKCMLFTPLVVSSAELKKSLCKEPQFRESYKLIKSCTISMVSIGAEEAQNNINRLIKNINPDENIAEVKQKVAGEVITYFMDKDGQPVEYPYRDHLIMVELNDYLRIPVRLGVAGLPVKAKAIHAALRGKYINILIVDKKTALILENL
ncbi:transcriptional regulator [Spirochaetia bacterium]|nr:transcriptional regulator [Spirochaetia bacterium]